MVRIGVTTSSSDAPFYIAEDRGYFEDEGVEAEVVSFKGGSEMTAPLGTGELSVGSGAPTAALYNAASRKVQTRMVADKSRPIDGKSYMALLVRKDLVDSGKVKTPGDLKGMKIADYSETGTTQTSLEKMLAVDGVKLSQVTRTYLGGPEGINALENGGVDAAMSVEPLVTKAEADGKVVRLEDSSETYPNQQIGVVLFSEKFASQNEEEAQAFMRAYIRAARDYNDALEEGRLTGPGSEEIVDILVEATGLDAKTLKEMRSHGVDPDGQLNVESLEEDLEGWQKGGFVADEDVSVEDIVDTSFADDAAEELGEYTKGKE